MDVLLARHEPVPALGSLPAGTTLLLTDRDDLAAAASAAGVEHRRVDPLRDAPPSDDVTSADTLVVAWGGDGTPAYDTVLRFTRACLSLVRAVCAARGPAHLVVLAERTDALAPLLDGMAVSAALEEPLLHTSVRYDGPVTGDRLAAWIAAAAAHPGTRLEATGDEIARVVHRPADLAPARPGDVLGAGDTVVLVGGAGGIGLRLCRYLADRFGARVVVLGRGTPDQQRAQALRDAGAAVHLSVPADEPDALDEAFRYVRERFGPIRLAVNLAGVLRDGLLCTLSPDSLDAVLRPKAGVALGLAALRGPHRPDRVVQFGSLTAITGNAGQAVYGAANAFLGGLAENTADWLCVDWGLWDTDGMRMPDGTSGLRALDPDAACAALVDGLAAGVRRLVVLDGDVRLDPEPREEQHRAEPTPVDLRARAARWVRDVVVRHTGLTRVGDRDNLLDHGVDSVGSVRISREVETRLDPGGRGRVSRALVLQHPTIAALTDHLVDTMPAELAAHLGDVPTEARPAEPEARPVAPGDTPPAPRPIAASPIPEPTEPTVSPGDHRPDDIAIIGLAGEFPNGDDVDAFWRSLLRGEDAVRVIPEDRWDWRPGYSPEPDEPGSAHGRHGGFLAHALDFDPVFFGIAPAEAAALDPQERRFLQTAYHAWEDAGRFAGPERDAGVFVAAMFGHYQDLDSPDRVVGSSFAAIANRVSHALDLHGPSVAVDTMCSGGLTALHLAATAIRAGDCEVALAGGVNVMPHPGKYRLLSQGKFLSPTGACHAFGVAADGYVPGEGSAAVVLKRLSSALRDGDRVHAVLRATAINSGGRTAGFTVPSEDAQHRVITAALTRADLDPAAVTYVEAHGTGTALGDPIEVRALVRAYGGPDLGEAHLGAVKSNIGHLESAAALAGLVKVVRQLATRTLVPTLHCELENPELNLEDSRFALVKQARPWPAGPRSTRFAGLSSFGAGGSNGHAIIQEFAAPTPTPPTPAWCFIPLSGRDEDAVRRRAADLADHLRANPDASLYGLSWTLCRARQHLRSRRGHWVRDLPELLDVLSGGEQPRAEVDDAWARAATDYLDGRTPDFAPLFPVPMLVDAPLYPFAADRYVVPSLDRRATPSRPARRAPDSLPLTPVWRSSPVEAGRPVRRILLVHDRGGDGPTPPPDLDVLRVGPDDLLDSGALARLADRAGSEHLHWVDVRREWTVAEMVAFAAFLHDRSTSSTVLSVSREDDSPESRAMPGFLHGVAEENPHVRSVRLRTSAAGWAPLLAELAADGDATEVRVIDGDRRVRDLAEVPHEPAARLREGGRYLLTGGFGEVGRAIAEHLVEHHRAEVVVVGRSAPDAGQLAWLAEHGLRHERADVTSAEQTHDLVDRVVARLGGLDGVIHSAGVLRDSLAHTKTAADAEAVLAPKVLGTRNLDQATARLDLDLFCVFASISGVLGNVGQSDYIAANRFLDEFAADRARQVSRGERSGFTLSVDWPLWLASDGSRAERGALAAYLRDRFGMEPLTADRGARLFTELVDSTPEGCHQVLACVGDTAVLRARLLDPPAPRLEPEDHAVATTSVEEISTRLADLVREQTGLRPADVTVEASWGDLGYSSVMLQRLSARVGAAFGVETPPNALFRYRDIKSLSHYLRDRGVAVDPEPLPPPEEPSPELSPELSREPARAPERDGIAVIGMSGVLPGGDDLDDFWRLLVDNRSAVRRVDRWKGLDQDCFAGTIDGYDRFDHTFFGVSAREAVLMDPQHRLFLQTAYNALLDAGLAPGSVCDVGVFAGVQFAEYQALLRDSPDRAHAYSVTGNAHAMLANRVSHLLDLTGPSQTVDTACSSALVALNRGVLSLAAGECEVALVGAVSVLVDPASTEAATGLGVLSPDFRCATFDKDANGYVRGEGVGCVVLKRLSDARRDRDPVLAVLERVVENHDGRANSLTAPNPEAQVALLTKAYTPELAERLSYVEAHGTGTALGDPIEVGALRTVLERLVPHRPPGAVALGAVKTNVGHLEPAAGMAGLLKVLLCLRNRELPANLHLTEQNPLIDLEGSPLRLLRHNEEWTATGPLVAGISSFGFGGSNAHAVLSEPPPPAPVRRPSRPLRLVVLSARSAWSLAAMRDALVRGLRAAPDTDLADIAHTLATGRDHFEHRLAWLAADTADLLAQAEAARPDEVPRRERKRLTTEPIAVPDDTEHGYRATLDAVRARYLDGAELDWPALFADGEYRGLALPGYAFEPTGFWFE
ncbi:SDR family NAD(P)-dependent oxidoreductase [Umezawaea sp. NPDC059074]|uniref:SDR family NAD(P)-dependent oxidoreductase n=1 Tax=Umezawaea sp. NPDC059074 TaxID=3346716 RepID=UPI0036C4C4DE